MPRAGEEIYDFVLGDVFKTDFREFGTFDMVLCLGLFYHVTADCKGIEAFSLQLSAVSFLFF